MTVSYHLPTASHMDSSNNPSDKTDEHPAAEVGYARAPGGGAVDMTSPLSGLGHVDQAGIVLAGFRDCSEEALHYLIHVEKIPQDDPLILGLKQHLFERQQHLDVGRILNVQLSQQQHTSDSPDNTAPFSPSSVTSSSSSYLSTHTVEGDHIVEGMEDAMLGRLHDRSSSMESDNEMVDDSDLSFMSEDTIGLPDVSGTAAASEQQLVPPSDVQDVESAPMLNLALLAQNNPAIASLTEEILALLEGEIQDDDTEHSGAESDCE